LSIMVSAALIVSF